MLDKTKTDSVLGASVNEMLLELGVETPMVGLTPLTSEDKYASIKDAVFDIMQCLGLDTEDDSLARTPHRIAKMFLDELFWGLDYDNFPKITTIENKMQYNSLLMERHIKVHSMCEHHFVPIIGEAFIAYIPNERVIGLSKINRVVEFFCRRPQVQERLCEQIFHTLRYILGTESVAVLIRAEHSCVKVRGIEDINSDTQTCRFSGAFNEVATRGEFYSLIGMNND
jgi:GTP cyclohydrolase I